MTSEKIIFYAMKGCGHCENAEIALAEEINSGKIKVLSNFEAPYGVQGFPHFVNTINKKTLTGWPGSKKDLLERLECKEFYDDIDDFFNTPIKDMYGNEKFKENFPANIAGNTCYKNCWSINGGPPPQLIKSTNDWPKNQSFYDKYYPCLDSCDNDAKAAAAKAKKAPPSPTTCCPRYARFVKDRYLSRDGRFTFDTLNADCISGKCPLKNFCHTNNQEYNRCMAEGFSENYEPESMPSYPVVQSMEPIPPSIHYYHDMGAGYSKLSNCWVKRPDFTA